VRVLIAIGTAALAASACTAELEPEVCPTVGVGDLVVTEVRGNQDDALGEWIELANVSGATIELRGLHLDVRKLDGSGADRYVVRRSVTVAAGARVVLGSFTTPPAYVDYGWHPDGLGAGGAIAHLPDGGALDVSACDVTIDRVVWNDLPGYGTYSLGGVPDANANDPASAWCVDAPPPPTNPDDPPPPAPGTPGEDNVSCP
jgi:hypothetical protein